MKTGSKMVFVAAALFAFAGARAGEFKTQASVPYSEESIVASKIKRECSIDSQLPAAVKRFASGSGNQVELLAELDTASGQVLKMEFFDAMSAGNAWIGHRKSVTVKGWLFRDGQQVAKFVARRDSTGGFAGGFKGSCAVLERTVNAIGRDIAGWLANPVDGAQLGDLS